VEGRKQLSSLNMNCKLLTVTAFEKFNIKLTTGVLDVKGIVHGPKVEPLNSTLGPLLLDPEIGVIAGSIAVLGVVLTDNDAEFKYAVPVLVKVNLMDVRVKGRPTVLVICQFGVWLLLG
jgi:hypothetical protein